MSSGASPSTTMCHPFPRTAQAGSRFAVQYQVAVKVIRARPALVPVTIIRRPATVPASSVPAAMVSFSGVTATSPVEVTEFDRQADRLGDQSHRRAERVGAVGESLRRELVGRVTEAHEVEEHLR